ncbi:MAG: lasso peptide isopeptide bond-forming cyclase [Calothrix sp. MO_192.B10]|nr:lasso peptide isopeptide bond-forming cyclase [Calothrix sp. MO_192.B10]
MSGIVGIYNLDGRPVESEQLGSMVDILAHRGPDGADVWCSKSIGLGHRMLWTTPESLLEKLPLVSQTGDLVITADARIDNRDELISALELNDRPAEKITDSQLILAAYEKWGEQCPDKLLGDFAFAIWDAHKQQLFCARDHFGVKPFYYYQSEQTFAFATEIKALMCLPEVPQRLHETRVAEHLASAISDATITFYRDIQRLPSAHSMTVNREGKFLKSYWSLDPTRELQLGSNEEYAEAFRKIFTEAVRCRMRSAFPVGSMLSGGLDSSSITCVARQLALENNQCNLHTFSNINEQVTECDESFYQDVVLNQGNLETHRLNINQISPLVDLNRVLWHQDEVQGLGNLYATWCQYKSAQEQGVRVLLDGYDGDSTVSHGTGYLIELACAGRWLTLASEVRAWTKHLGQPWLEPFWAWVQIYGINPLISRFLILRVLRRIYLGLLRRVLRKPQPSVKRSAWSSILNPSFIERHGLLERKKTVSVQPKTEREKHYRNLTDPAIQNTLEKLNSAAGAFSVELRFPFWDKRLVEFCLSLPPEQKRNQGWGRMVMRRAMEGILPQEVQWRGSKTDHRLSLDRGLLLFERERLDELILNNPEQIKTYVDINALQEAYHRFVSGEALENETVIIWNVLSLSMWLQITGIKASDDSLQAKEEYITSQVN